MSEREPKRIAFSNRYMFNRVMLNESICKGVIETVLGIRPTCVNYLNAEQAIEVRPGSRGIRMDVYVEASGKVYDIEMQVYTQLALGRRFRYYQSAIDTNLLKKSEAYDKLPESYIVFLCLADPFGFSLPVYSFERTCRENPEVDIDCGAHWRALNASAWHREEASGLRNLLKYLETGDPSDDPLIKGIEAEVEAANNDARWVKMAWAGITIEENDRMQYRMRLHEATARGLEQGLEQGERRIERLIDLLLDDGRIDDVRRQIHDIEYREALLEEYGIS